MYQWRGSEYDPEQDLDQIACLLAGQGREVYWREIRRRATQNTNQALGVESRGRIVILFLFGVIALGALWSLGYGNDAQTELVFRLISTAIIVLAWPITWAVYYFLEQPKIYDEIASTRDALAKRLEPNIAILKIYDWTSPKLAKGKAIRTYRLRIKNISGETVRKCQVKMTAMINRVGEPTFYADLCFKLSTEEPDWAEYHQTYFNQFVDIFPNDHVDFDLIRLDERVDGATHILMCYALRAQLDKSVGNAVPIERCPHILSLRVVAENCPTPLELSSTFYVDTTGLLKMEVTDV